MAKCKKTNCKNLVDSKNSHAKQKRLCLVHYQEYLDKQHKKLNPTEKQCQICERTVFKKNNKFFCSSQCLHLSHFLKREEWQEINLLFSLAPDYLQQIEQLSDIEKIYFLIEKQVIKNKLINNGFFKHDYWILNTKLSYLNLNLLISSKEITPTRHDFKLLEIPSKILSKMNKKTIKNKCDKKNDFDINHSLLKKYSPPEIINFYICLNKKCKEKNSAYIKSIENKIFESRHEKPVSLCGSYKNRNYPIYNSLAKSIIKSNNYHVTYNKLESYNDRINLGGDIERCFCFFELLAITVFHALITHDKIIINKIIDKAKNLTSINSPRNENHIIKITNIVYTIIIRYINKHFKLKLNINTAHTDNNFWKFYSSFYYPCKNKIINSSDELIKSLQKINLHDSLLK